MCRAPIGFRYFLAELALGAAAAFLYLHFPPVDAALRLAFCTTLLIIAFIDYDWRVIHNAITLGGIIGGLLAASFLMPEVGWKSSLAGFIAGAGFLFLTGVLYSLLRRAEGVGLGDVYLLGMVGAFLGVAGVIFTIFFGSIFGAVGGLAFALSGGAPAAARGRNTGGDRGRDRRRHGRRGGRRLDSAHRGAVRTISGLRRRGFRALPAATAQLVLCAMIGARGHMSDNN